MTFTLISVFPVGRVNELYQKGKGIPCDAYLSPHTCN